MQAKRSGLAPLVSLAITASMVIGSAMSAMAQPADQYVSEVETVMEISDSIQSVLESSREISVASKSEIESYQQEILDLQDQISDLPSEQQQALEGSMESLDNAMVSADAMSDALSAVESGNIDAIEDTPLENSWRYINGELIDDAIENAEAEADDVIDLATQSVFDETFEVQDVEDDAEVELVDGDENEDGEISADEADAVLTKIDLSARPQVILVGAAGSKTGWGPDVSHHNGTLNWSQIKSAGAKFAILRICQGSSARGYVNDRQWAANVAACEKLGIPYGVYIYSKALTTAEVDAEVTTTLNYLKGHNPTMPVYYDMEDNAQGALSYATISGFATRYCKKIKEAGYKAGVYSSTSWYNTKLASFAKESGYYHWIAQWASTCKYTGNYEMWQYTSDGKIGSHTCRFDMNYWYGAMPATSHTITFNGNGATSGSMSAQKATAGKATTLSKNTFKKTSSIFVGWDTKADGTGTGYADGASVTPSANMTLYAVWKDSKKKSLEEIAREVMNNEWSKNETRKQRLEAAGYDYAAVQQAVNDILSGNETIAITFSGNGSTGGNTATIKVKKNTATALTANGFTKTGYQFAGWNTKADGGGTSYKDKQAVTLSGNTTLYAQWKPVTYSITFSGNGASGSMAAQTMTSGKAAALNANAFTKTGYAFSSWNTKADGGGTPYNNKQSITATKNMTLHAIWKPVSYAVRFNGNGATGGAMSNENFSYDSAKALTANAFSRTGYEFSGWNTKADGKGTAYANKASVRNLANTQGAVVNLYAQWKALPKVTYNGNGGSTPAAQTGKAGTALNGTSSKTGYTFAGWYTSASGGSKVTTIPGANATYYAHWNANQYTIAFNGNGATSGSMAAQTAAYDKTLTLKKNAFKKTGYTFLGWCIKANGIGTGYKNQAMVKNLTSTANGKVTLYAIWHKNGQTKSMDAVAYEVINGFWGNNADRQKNLTNAGYDYVLVQQRVNEILYGKEKAPTVAVQFKGNGATSGATASQSIKKKTSTALRANGFARKGYTFAGWNTKANGKGTAYKNKQSVKLSDNLTLYAQWKKR